VIEEPHEDNQTSSIRLPEEHHIRAHAIPQENFSYGQFSRPEWSKKIPGLSGFVTLGDPIGFGDNNISFTEFEDMDIPSLVHQDFNFNLGRIFDENDNHELARRASGMGIPIDGLQGHGGMMYGEKGNRRQSMHGRKHSKSQDKVMGEMQGHEGRMSFFKEYLPMLLEHHWKEILEHATKFFEFEKSFDCQKNCENLMFLEEHKETYGNTFENIYHNHYLKIVGKIRECVENFSITGESILKILYDEFCGLFSELFNFIKNCTSDYCFDLMKNKTNTAKATRNNLQTNIVDQEVGQNTRKFEPMSQITRTGDLYQERVPTQQQSHQRAFVSTGQTWENPEIEEKKVEHSQLLRGDISGSMQIEKLESLAHIIDCNVGRKTDLTNKAGANSSFNFRGVESNVSQSELESVASESTRKFQRKYWSAAELQELENLSNQYYPNNIPIERLEEFARKYSRTLNAVQSKISKTKKERVKKQTESYKIEMSSNGTSRNDTSTQRRYEVTVENMIKGALQQFPDNTATNEEIIQKIKELYFREGMEGNEERLKNSISQTLSSSKSITVIKGTYGLRSREYLVLDRANAKTMRSRLQYILSNVPNFRLDIATIRRLYLEHFFDSIDSDNVWETSITKVLKQSQEFDSSHCKTKYSLIVRDPSL